MGCSLSAEKVTRDPVPGSEYILETIGLSLITGIRDYEGWLYRKTDQELADDANRFHDEFEERKRTLLAENRTMWAREEAALPEWLRSRLERFRTNGGEHFELDGWGYELAVCRLAVAYADGDDARVDELDEELGCSGNQHDIARLLVRIHRDNPKLLPQAPSALTPLTGDPFYLKG